MPSLLHAHAWSITDQITDIREIWSSSDQIAEATQRGLWWRWVVSKRKNQHIILFLYSYLFIKFWASPSNLWGNVSTVIGCSITSWFLMMMQFHLRRSLKGTNHTAVTRMARRKSVTRNRMLTSRRPHTRTHTWKLGTLNETKTAENSRIKLPRIRHLVSICNSEERAN